MAIYYEYALVHMTLCRRIAQDEALKDKIVSLMTTDLLEGHQLPSTPCFRIGRGLLAECLQPTFHRHSAPNP
jgi:hypothetical protein